MTLAEFGETLVVTKLIIVNFSPFCCFGYSVALVSLTSLTPPVHSHPVDYETKSNIRVQLEQVNMQYTVQFVSLVLVCEIH